MIGVKRIIIIDFESSEKFSKEKYQVKSEKYWPDLGNLSRTKILEFISSLGIPLDDIRAERIRLSFENIQ